MGPHRKTLTMYESDLTKFMRQYLLRHPEEIRSQKIGRGVWWDKEPNVRTEPPEPLNAPTSGGAEYTFKPFKA